MKNNLQGIFILVMLLITIVGCNVKKSTSKDKIGKKVDSVLSLMTLEEKIGQMNQYNGFWDATGPAPTKKEGAETVKKYEHLKKGWVGAMLNVRGVKNVRAVQKIAVEQTRLGIPLLIGFDVIHGYKTQSPIPLAESASWDLKAIEKSATIAAKEAAASGINWTFAPMVDISRDARWGRVMEGAGEDPFLGSRIAVARIRGFQGDDLSKNNTIAACAKHFAGYGFSESGRDYNTVDVGTTTLYNTILPPFKAAVGAGVKTFMNSFNELNGVPATGNGFLQRTILKGKWNFKGFVVSDWGSMVEMVNHGYVKDKMGAAKVSVKAGSDMDMESYVYVSYLAKLVRDAKVSEKIIDDAVRRILRVKFELGLFEDPYKYCNEQREKEVVGSQKHHQGVLEMAKKSVVLLKNDKQLLPLKKKGLQIAVIGDLADDKDSPLGSWSLGADRNSAVSVLEGLSKYTQNKITYSEGVKLVSGDTHFIFETSINTTDRKGIKQAVKTAKGKDVVIMVLGEIGFMSGEGRSRTNLDLPGLQQELLEAVYKVNKNIVLVLMNGRPLVLNWADKHIPSIVEAWHLGSQSGNAIAQILYGDYNPSGKLPMSFPRNVGQIPIYYNYKNTGRPTIPAPNQVFWSHYTDAPNTPLYPFGYGLSYTQFAYQNLEMDTNKVTDNQSIELSFTLKNTGKYDGQETVQLYIRDLVASVTRPVKELKAFKKVFLEKGQSKKVRFTIDKEMLKFYDAEGNYILEKGDFKVFVGGSSAQVMQADFSFE